MIFASPCKRGLNISTFNLLLRIFFFFKISKIVEKNIKKYNQVDVYL